MHAASSAAFMDISSNWFDSVTHCVPLWPVGRLLCYAQKYLQAVCPIAGLISYTAYRPAIACSPGVCNSQAALAAAPLSHCVNIPALRNRLLTLRASVIFTTPRCGCGFVALYSLNPVMIRPLHIRALYDLPAPAVRYTCADLTG